MQQGTREFTARLIVGENCRMSLMAPLHSDADLLVQSFYGLTLNKLQHKLSQQFLVQKNMLYNIQKVLRNHLGGKRKKVFKKSH